jgi:hypothetical protein
MTRLFAALDIDFAQWWALTRTALRVDLRTSTFVRGPSGAQARAAAAFIAQLVFYTMMGFFIALFVWLSRDVFMSSALTITYVMFMIGTAALLDHNAAIVSPDDYAILGYRPITSRTYFAARLTNVLVYTTAMTTLFGYLPIGSYFIRWGPAVGLGAIVGVYGASVAVALTMVVAYAWLMRAIGPRRIKRVLSYVQFLFSFLVYGGYFFLTNLLSEKMLATMTLPKTGWMLLLPPVWFASYVELGAGHRSLTEIVPAGAAVVALAVLAIAVGGRLSLDYADRLGAIAAAPTAVSTKAPAAARPGRWFRSGEARAMALLIRSQFANDMKFRMGVLAIVPLTVIYLVMGISRQGTLGDPFVQGRSAQALRMVSIAMLMFPSMLKINLGRSDAYRASWIYFACPADRTKLLRAAKNILVAGFLLPYILLVAIVLAFLTNNIWHLVIHLIIVGLLSHLALQAITFVEPELPFSKPMAKGRSSTTLFVVMSVVGVGAVLLPLAAPLIYANAAATVLTMAALVGASFFLEQLTRVRVEAQASKLEFEG